MLYEFLVAIAAVAKGSCRHGLWLVACVNKKDAGHQMMSGIFFVISKRRRR